MRRWTQTEFESMVERREKRAFRLTRPTAPEAQVLKACKDLLDAAPAVVWHARMNVAKGYLLPYRVGRRLLESGALSPSEARWMEFAFEGCPDIIGQLRDGRLLAVETKRKGGPVRPAQAAFLARVEEGNGVAVLTDDASELFKRLNLV